MVRNDIVTVTLNPTVDLSMEVDALNAEGKNRARMNSVRAGGGGINVARCIARLGGCATAIHTTGRETGRRLDRLLDAEGLRHVGIGIDSDTREAFVIADVSSGSSYHVVPPGPRLTTREESLLINSIRTACAEAGFLVVSGSATSELRDDFSAQLVREGPSSTKVILDIGGDQLRTALTEHSFLIRLDRREGAALLGRQITSHADARAVNDMLLAGRSCDHAVTTVGALGAVYSDHRAHYEISAPPLPHPFRSDACAGDSLVAAITYYLAAGREPLRACEFGVAAAAATVQLSGTDVFDRAGMAALVRRVRSRRISRNASFAAAPGEPVGNS
ncbi:1-phosphofructokinase family hexose kinase [Nocardia cyriacigeorgica]|uniref:Phosphofructokinase pfkB n=1 Tax=Nocardia cyriacigeorgica TaxID=135487 RepID=A0A4U8VZ73_9NOCA|nr:PfkB family carbohydrate kinase [Nocardia cyriacigeorgica]VFA98065.1 Putative phosphofructokinase pfkB [Nocardia cyriacigeorgica]